MAVNNSATLEQRATAVREIALLLRDIPANEQERILRAVWELLGLKVDRQS